MRWMTWRTLYPWRYCEEFVAAVRPLLETADDFDHGVPDNLGVILGVAEQNVLGNTGPQGLAARSTFAAQLPVVLPMKLHLPPL